MSVKWTSTNCQQDVAKFAIKYTKTTKSCNVLLILIGQLNMYRKLRLKYFVKNYFTDLLVTSNKQNNVQWYVKDLFTTESKALHTTNHFLLFEW